MKISDLILDMQIPRIDDVYYPSDDSYLIIDYLDTPEFEETLKKLSIFKKKLRILDMGCGTGILGFCIVYKLISSGLFDSLQLTFADINPKAIETVKFMMDENVYHLKSLSNFREKNITVDYFHSDLFHEIPPQTFNLIVFNPPYLPQDEEIHNPKPIDQALYAGPEGITVLKEFFNQVKPYVDANSEIYFITSSLGSLNKLLPDVSREYQITLQQNFHMFFEDIGLFLAKKKTKNHEQTITT